MSTLYREYKISAYTAIKNGYTIREINSNTSAWIHSGVRSYEIVT